MQPDPAIVEGAVEALEHGQTHYVDVLGIAPLRERLAVYLRDAVGLVGYEQANVYITAGIQECRFLSIQVIGESFGRIAMSRVVHPGARQAAGVRRIDVRSLPVDEENGMLPMLSGMQEALSEGCRLLYLESPVRLTGAAFDDATVKQMAAMVDDFDAGVIWDQGVAPWAQTAQYSSLGAVPGMAGRVAVFGEVWPGVGLESWLVGYMAASQEWVERMRSQKQVVSICTSTPSQFAAHAAADVYATLHDAHLEEMARYRREALRLACELGAKPLSGCAASLIAVRVPDPERTSAALRRAGYWVADGADFGARGVLRLLVRPGEATAEVPGCLG